MSLGLAILMVACTSSPVVEAEAEPEPSGWSWDGQAPDEGISVDELATSTQALVDQLLEINAWPVLESYTQVMSYSLDWCPEQVETSSETTGDMRYWDGVCAGTGDVWFKGPMTTWTWEGIEIAAGEVELLSDMMSTSTAFDGYAFNGAGIRGQTDIYSEDGAVDFNCSCAAMQGVGQTEDGRVGFFSYMDGPSHWTGDASTDTWMEDGVRPGLWLWVEADPTTELRHVTAEGNVTGFAERYDTASLTLTLFGPLDRSASCVGDLSSFALSIRDAETADWTDLEFAIDSSDPATCPACAELPDGQEVCVELSALLAWGTSPW